MLVGIPEVMAIVLAVCPTLPSPPGGGQEIWIQTGEGIREKNFALVHIQAYTISHWVKTQPSTSTRSAMIDLEADKRFSIRMLRDVGASRMKGMFRDAFALNGYRDLAKVETFLAAFTRDFTNGDRVEIAYVAEGQTTSISVQGGGSATLQGRDFMRAVWSLWFGQTDQPALGEALISGQRIRK